MGSGARVANVEGVSPKASAALGDTLAVLGVGSKERGGGLGWGASWAPKGRGVAPAYTAGESGGAEVPVGDGAPVASKGRTMAPACEEPPLGGGSTARGGAAVRAASPCASSGCGMAPA